jgi:peptide/nickel transport system permease protein
MVRDRPFATYVLAVFVILSLNFILPRLMPGDPLLAIYGEEALLAMSPELKEELVRRFSLDRSLSAQFLAYLAALFRGDLGHSYYFSAPVSRVLLGFLPWTLLLTGVALCLCAALGVVLGIESGARRGRPQDAVLLSSALFLGGFPDFFAGTLLLLFFGVTLGVAPLAGALTPYAGKAGLSLVLDVLHHLTLPLLTLVVVRVGPFYLLTRNTMVTTLGEAFILTARAKGCPDRTVRYRHAGRHSLLPVVTAAGLQYAHLITGALFVEMVFSYPGMGTLLYRALLTRDYPLIQGILLTAALAVLTVNFLLELVYVKVDPRVVRAR